MPKRNCKTFANDACPHFGVALSVFLIALPSGCTSRPATLYAPDIDAQLATDDAFSKFDVNKDGTLDQNELKNCPGVLNSMNVYDADGNASVSRDEFENRIKSWKTDSPAMMSVECRVMLDGRPLPGATIRFIPEEYLQDFLEPAAGVTADNGIAALSLPPEEMPSQLSRIKAVTSGTYKVKITHPSKPIPDRYNTTTILGREVSKQTTVSPFDEFELTSK